MKRALFAGVLALSSLLVCLLPSMLACSFRAPASCTKSGTKEKRIEVSVTPPPQRSCLTCAPRHQSLVRKARRRPLVAFVHVGSVRRRAMIAFVHVESSSRIRGTVTSTIWTAQRKLQKHMLNYLLDFLHGEWRNHAHNLHDAFRDMLHQDLWDCLIYMER